MQFLTSLFGGTGNMWLTAVFALGAVILLILIGTWLLKLLTGAGDRMARGRNRRLSLIDSLPIDGKRQLLIIRRDDIEHLILTGGPSDVVIERGISVPQPPARTVPPQQAARRTGPVVTQGMRPAAAPASQAAAATPTPKPAPAPAPHVEPTPAAAASNVSPLDRMRGFAGKRANSHRHPGLVRPVAPLDRTDHPQPGENSGGDSVKEFGQRGAGGHGDFADESEQSRAEGRLGDKT